MVMCLRWKVCFGLFSFHNGGFSGIPANGTASLRTGEAFTCHIWVKDVLVALQDAGLILLSTDIGKYVISYAMRYRR